jgi:hypothetical protein
MSRGFVIFADNSEIDYVRQAYALALSIKLTQPEYLNAVSLITSDEVPTRYRSVFDKIVEIPWYEKTQSRYKTEHRWKIYHASPYEETVVLDADMLVLKDIQNYWKIFEKHKVYYSSTVLDYRGNVANNDYYRKAFTGNNLPNFYSALHYFNKSEMSKNFYAWVELISNNWELFYGKYVSEHYPGMSSMDITAALTSKILTEKNEFTSVNPTISFVHMKPMLQGWREPKAEWMQAVGIYFDRDCNLKIGNFTQNQIVHYVDQEFLTDDIIDKLERKLQI